MSPPAAAAARGRPHVALSERRADNWETLHTTFVRCVDACSGFLFFVL